MKKLTLFLLFFYALSAQAEDPGLRAILLNRQGVHLLKKEKPEEALQKFSEALESASDAAFIHVNIGLAFEALEQPEKALQAYRTAEQFASGPEEQFIARFNQGALHQKNKKVDLALDSYHAALEVNPESRETKINIELLIQQQQGKGQGEGEDKKDDSQSGQDKQEQKKDGEQKQDQQGEGQPNQEKENKEYAKQPKPQPKPFKSEELNQGDVNKILGELRNQEQRIRSEYNKREVKEKAREKNW